MEGEPVVPGLARRKASVSPTDMLPQRVFVRLSVSGPVEVATGLLQALVFLSTGENDSIAAKASFAASRLTSWCNWLYESPLASITVIRLAGEPSEDSPFEESVSDTDKGEPPASLP